LWNGCKFPQAALARISRMATGLSWHFALACLVLPTLALEIQPCKHLTCLSHYKFLDVDWSTKYVQKWFWLIKRKLYRYKHFGWKVMQVRERKIRKEYGKRWLMWWKMIKRIIKNIVQVCCMNNKWSHLYITLPFSLKFHFKICTDLQGVLCLLYARSMS